MNTREKIAQEMMFELDHILHRCTCNELLFCFCWHPDSKWSIRIVVVIHKHNTITSSDVAAADTVHDVI